VVPPRDATPPAAESPLLERVSRAKEQAETETILSALYSTRWNRKEAAQLLGIEYKALLYKMKKLSIKHVAAAQPDQGTGRTLYAAAKLPASNEPASPRYRSLVAGAGD
jgi:hypothetical protein